MTSPTISKTLGSYTAHDQEAATRVAQRAEPQRRADEYVRAHRAAASARAAAADSAAAAAARPVERASTDGGPSGPDDAAVGGQGGA